MAVPKDLELIGLKWGKKDMGGGGSEKLGKQNLNCLGKLGGKRKEDIVTQIVMEKNTTLHPHPRQIVL